MIYSLFVSLIIPSVKYLNILASIVTITLQEG